jgi:hypothetical protein
MSSSPNVPTDDAKNTEEELLQLLEKQQAQIKKMLDEMEANLAKFKQATRDIKSK